MAQADKNEGRSNMSLPQHGVLYCSLHCTHFIVHCIVLHTPLCTLHYTVLYCSALPCTVQYNAAQYSTVE